VKKQLFSELLASVREAGAIHKGATKPSRVFTYKPTDIKRIRKRLHVSQAQFSMLIGVSKGTLQNWEQGRRQPEGPAKALLRVVEKKPEAVLEALQS